MMKGSCFLIFRIVLPFFPPGLRVRLHWSLSHGGAARDNFIEGLLFRRRDCLVPQHNPGEVKCVPR